VHADGWIHTAKWAFFVALGFIRFVGESTSLQPPVPITCSVKGLKRRIDNSLLGECFARPISLSLRCGFQDPLFFFRPRLAAQTQFCQPLQDFFPGGNPPWYILSYKAGDVVLNTQLHEGIFCELLVGQSLAHTLVQIPRQH